MEWGFQRLSLMDIADELPWLTYKQFENMAGILTNMIVKEQNWQPLFDELWNNRHVENYTSKNINKRDFTPSWSHSHTAKRIFIEEVLKNGVMLDDDMLFENPDLREQLKKGPLENFRSSSSQKPLLSRTKLFYRCAMMVIL